MLNKISKQTFGGFVNVRIFALSTQWNGGEKQKKMTEQEIQKEIERKQAMGVKLPVEKIRALILKTAAKQAPRKLTAKEISAIEQKEIREEQKANGTYVSFYEPAMTTAEILRMNAIKNAPPSLR